MSKWTYQGENGCEYWGHQGFDICYAGSRQSPININSDDAQQVPMSKCDLKVSASYGTCKCMILNTGYTIKLSPKRGKAVKCSLKLDGDKYNLIQFHFHAPSEHAIDDKLYMLELHLVHQSAAGALTVLGFMFEIGEESEFLAQFLGKVPNEKGETKRLKGEISFEGLEQIYDKSPAVWRYDGGLTTPPCSEGVNWCVFQDKCTMSQEQYDLYKAMYPMETNRPVQFRNDRWVKSYK